MKLGVILKDCDDQDFISSLKNRFFIIGWYSPLHCSYPYFKHWIIKQSKGCLLYFTNIYIYIYIYIYWWNILKTSRSLKHKNDIRISNLSNALFQYISQSNHNFDFNSARVIIYIHYKRRRQIFEAAAISLSNSVNTCPRFYNIAPYLSKSILNSYNIFHL